MNKKKFKSKAKAKPGANAAVARAHKAQKAQATQERANATTDVNTRLSRSGRVVVKQEIITINDDSESSSSPEPQCEAATASTNGPSTSRTNRVETDDEPAQNKSGEFAGLTPNNFYSNPQHETTAQRSIRQRQQQSLTTLHSPSASQTPKRDKKVLPKPERMSTRSTSLGNQSTASNDPVSQEVKEEIEQSEVELNVPGMVTRRRATASSTLAAIAASPAKVAPGRTLKAKGVESSVVIKIDSDSDRSPPTHKSRSRASKTKPNGEIQPEPKSELDTLRTTRSRVTNGKVSSAAPGREFKIDPDVEVEPPKTRGRASRNKSDNEEVKTESPVPEDENVSTSKSTSKRSTRQKSIDGMKNLTDQMEIMDINSGENRVASPLQLNLDCEPGTSGVQNGAASPEASTSQTGKSLRRRNPPVVVSKPPKKAPKPKSVQPEEKVSSKHIPLKDLITKEVYLRAQRSVKPTPNPFHVKTKLKAFAKLEHMANIYYVAFNTWLAESSMSIFAVAGDQNVSVFECHENSKKGFKLLFTFTDEDDVFNTCAWTFNRRSARSDNYILAGGKLGLLRVFYVLDPEGGGLALEGHTGAINEIQVDPKEPDFVFSCSSDWTIRMWNMKSFHTVAIFGGWAGHRDQVLSMDIHLSLDLFASCGVDRTVILWRYDSDEVKRAIEWTSSRKHVLVESNRPHVIHLPAWETHHPHVNYIDCIRWVGDFIMTRSCDKSIKLWKPTGEERDPLTDLDKLTRKFVTRDESNKNERNYPLNYILMHLFDFDTTDMFYFRMGLPLTGDLLAVGDCDGDIWMWDMKCAINEINHDIIEAPYTKTYGRCRTPVRHCAFNPAGNVMIAVQDGGYISRWDIKRIPRPCSAEAGPSKAVWSLSCRIKWLRKLVFF